MIKIFDVKLLFTGTDSLCYEVNNWNMYDKIYEHRDLFDLRNYSVDSKYSCRDNKKVVAKMKDEYGGIFISKLVGLNLKMYANLNENSNETTKKKGVNESIEFKEYYDTLFQDY